MNTRPESEVKLDLWIFHELLYPKL